MASSDSQPSGVEAYVLGREYSVMPIAIDWAHCVEIPAGPVTFVVEARSLTQDAIVANEEEQGRSDGIEHDYDDLHDYGASLHVLGAASREEYLRFDCFDHEPHYHYIRNDLQRNVVVRFDDIAEGDALDWTVARVATRLPEMLEHANAVDVAAAVREQRAEIAAGVVRLREVLGEAARRAELLRSQSSG